MSRRAQVFRDHAGGEARPSKHQADLAASRGEGQELRMNRGRRRRAATGRPGLARSPTGKGLAFMPAAPAVRISQALLHVYELRLQPRLLNTTARPEAAIWPE